MSRIEADAQRLWQSGESVRWLSGAADMHVAGVILGTNGPLMAALAKATAYHDPGVVDMLRSGGSLCGELQCTGNGRPCESGRNGSVAELQVGLEVHLRSILRDAGAVGWLCVRRQEIRLWWRRSGKMSTLMFYIRKCWQMQPWAE